MEIKSIIHDYLLETMSDELLLFDSQFIANLNDFKIRYRSIIDRYNKITNKKLRKKNNENIAFYLPREKSPDFLIDPNIGKSYEEVMNSLRQRYQKCRLPIINSRLKAT